jgi:glutathione S-transferase
LNTLEPHIQNLAAIDLFNAGEEWARVRRPAVLKMVTSRLASLGGQLDGRDFLEGSFTAADLLMATVLRNLRQTDILASFPVLDRYRARCEARPAFQKALADQMAVFAAHGPPQ